MLHLGDITKISGYTAPIVDVVVGGSPCQDLSVAGKRAGLDGERSGLFMDQVRIVKEMRDRDVRENGRSGVDVRPRYLVWENVPGAFSSNKGEDFRIVLEEIARVKDQDAVIPRPDKWQTSGCILGDGWSIAWRVLDAQFWGVPQRRRRIALVADFGGHSASEILFVSEGVCGDTQPSQPKGKAAPHDVTRGVGADDIFCIDGDKLNKKERDGGSGMGIREGNQYTLTAKDVHGVAYSFEPGIASREGGHIYENVSGTLRSNAGDNQMSAAYSIENHPADSRVDIDDTGKVQTLTSRMGTGGGNVPMVMEKRVFESHPVDSRVKELGAVSPTVTSKFAKGCADTPLVMEPIVFSKSKRAQTPTDYETWQESDTANTLNTFDQGDVRTNECVIDGGRNRPRYIVRRLTPLECERLQGYPDGWTDIGEYIDSNGKQKKSSDAARYKALGNSIAIPPWKWVMKRLCACYERDATLASLFDGIGGFPYIWEQINGKGSCLWASEIEEFPMAVTKVRIGE